jgi:hypothetical protein
MTGIRRYEGRELLAGSIPIAVAGGGVYGITAELDAVIVQAAEALRVAYNRDVEIRCNSDRESGGGWLVRTDGRNHHVGIGASLITARSRDGAERSAARYEAESASGRASWQSEPLTEKQRAAGRELARHDREWLAENPEGQLTVYAHLTTEAVRPELLGELAVLAGWWPMEHSSPGRAYHHGPAADVAAALARCQHFTREDL